MKKILEFLCAVLCISVCIPTISTTALSGTLVEIYSLPVANVETGEETVIEVISYHSNAYILPEVAAFLSETNYEEQDNELVFQSGYHKIVYDGQKVEHNEQCYIRMQDALDQLSCSYVYDTEQKRLFYVPTKSYVENLFVDCTEILYSAEAFDLSWINDIDHLWLVEAYEFLGEWNFFQKRERMEQTLCAIMTPKEMQSDLLNAISKSNKAVKSISTFAKNINEIVDVDIIQELLGTDASNIMYTYDYINKVIPGLSLSDTIDLLECAYNAQNASSLYVNSVKYGLYNNLSIEDPDLHMATQNVYSWFEDNQAPVEAFIENAIQSVAEGGMAELLEAAMEEGLLYENWKVKLVKLVTDEFLGMKAKSGAVLSLMDCAEIQKEAKKQYQGSFTIITPEYNDADPLQMKYSTILYLRACQHAYEEYSSTGEIGKVCANTMLPLIDKKIECLVAYSDEELTQIVKNDPLDFNLLSIYENETDREENTITDVTTPSTPAIDEISYYGFCGEKGNEDSVRWMLEPTGKTTTSLYRVDTEISLLQLTISGTGKMNDYEFYPPDGPWDGPPYLCNVDNGDLIYFEEQISSVIIEPGITHIGECAFNTTYTVTNQPNLEWIYIPSSVKSIGQMAFINFYPAFGYGGLKDIYYEGTEQQWHSIKIPSVEWQVSEDGQFEFITGLEGTTIHYNVDISDIKK